MPDDWPSAGADQGGRIRYTAAHELCHNIGLFDQYTGNDTDADFRPRDVTEWTLMAIEQKFPNLTVPERRKLGWLESRMVKKVAARSAEPSPTRPSTCAWPLSVPAPRVHRD